MYKLEKHPREEDRYPKNPTFSSSLLDEIYRSMAEVDQDNMKFHNNNEPKSKRQSFPKGGTPKPNNRGNRGEKEEEREVLALRRACLIEKWMDQKVSEKVVIQQRKKPPQFDHDILDHDPMFFSSTSSSSDSSSGGFSSSDNDSFYRTRPKASSYPLEKKPPKPIRTVKMERTLFYEQREEAHILEDSLIKSKSRALKIYSNLKKVKQPISPGGKLATFINSLFQAGQNGKKTPKSPALSSKPRSGEESACSSASSFSRSCLSKNSPSTREKLRNGVKRNVTFHPASLVADDQLKPVGQKKLYRDEKEEPTENIFGLTSLSLPTEWRIGKPKVEEAEEVKSRRVEEVAREFLKEYRHQKNINNVAVTRRDNNNNDFNNYRFREEYLEEEEDDVMSCSSSDLFELDHLSVIGADYRYQEELPVYETTRVETNRAIASGLRV